MLKRKTSNDIVQTAIRKLAAETNLTYFGPGSIAKNIVEAIAREIELLYDSIDINLSQTRLSSAAGAFLDLIAQQYGLQRLGGTTGTVLAEDAVMRFYTNQGRLIDHLPSSNLTVGIIPANTTITNRNGTITFRVPNDVNFPANATSVFVPITPSDSSLGSRNNLGAGSLTVHSLGTSKVLCENIANIVVGSDPETDEELRLRISRHINSKTAGSRSSIIEAAFSFPGVSDIKVYPFKHGAGSFEILVVPVTSTVSPNMIENIRASVESAVPYGIKVSVRGPNILGISFIIQLTLSRESLASERVVASQAVQVAIRNYLGNIRMGSELIINRLGSVILDAHSAISDYRIVQMAIDCRPQVVANYRLKEDQVFDLDRKLNTPILVIT